MTELQRAFGLHLSQCRAVSSKDTKYGRRCALSADHAGSHSSVWNLGGVVWRDSSLSISHNDAQLNGLLLKKE